MSQNILKFNILGSEICITLLFVTPFMLPLAQERFGWPNVVVINHNR